jgi:pyridinium-3,5-biscarboxylic acid mononucleotide synthase
MKPDNIKDILREISARKLSVDEGMKRLSNLAFEDLGFAKLDHHRALRTGIPEVIFAPGKTEKQIVTIFERFYKSGSNIMITRVNKQVFDKIRRKHKRAKYNPIARIIYLIQKPIIDSNSKTIAVISAGTSDIGVAEEASVTIEAFGCKVERLYDVGVAGIHRLLAHQSIIRKADVLIVVAGMEGALASVVGGLVSAPVIAVPTSIGYGASFGGVTALLSMLNSCAPGVTVANIDNGFGAAVAAIKMTRIKNTTHEE